ncbi:MAG: DJ-1/PfpI family protein [Acidobacteria bacterium]|nr:DJ-1/PfpI family protein [Acidobacteriota bacterium]
MRSFKLRFIPLLLAAIMCLGQIVLAQADQAASNARPQSPTVERNLAILLFDGVQIIDYTGPYETFGHAFKKDGSAIHIYTVGEKGSAITTSMGMSVNPTYSIENAPQPDILVLPGGNGVWPQLDKPNVMKWVEETANKAEVVLSVCNGAFFLAKAGLLDGLQATTTFSLIARLKEAAPKAHVVDNVRYVDNGKFITTAGLSSGIEGSLHLTEKLYGKGMAQMSAVGMEYNWQPDSTYVRAALAERYMPFKYEYRVIEDGWQPVLREGNPDRWENKWIVPAESAIKFLESINTIIAENKEYGGLASVKWNRLATDSAKSATQSRWQFTDEKGRVWNGTALVEPVTGEQQRFMFTVRIARASSSK